MKTELQNFLDMLDNADVQYGMKEVLGLRTLVVIDGVEFWFDDVGRLLEAGR